MSVVSSWGRLGVVDEHLEPGTLGISEISEKYLDGAKSRWGH